MARHGGGAMTIFRPLRVEDLANAVQQASSSGVPDGSFAIIGRGTWLPANRDRTAMPLDLSAFSGVRTYTPDDLTISVGAATTLAELDEVTRARGQWCPLLSWGTDASSVGAVIATATAGPFARALGRPRDLVLGLDCVDGRGRLIRAGGRVVKNVAGFDITRLMTGAWGTLGAITELHLRLRARPAVDETFAIALDYPDALEEFARGPFAPLGAVVLGTGDGVKVGAPASTSALVRLGGNAAFVAASRDALARLGRLSVVDPSIWEKVREHLAPPSPLERWRAHPLAARVKTAFDPRDFMNRGLFATATKVAA
jgi:glycolate oxidase FAD binding subunit